MKKVKDEKTNEEAKERKSFAELIKMAKEKDALVSVEGWDEKSDNKKLKKAKRSIGDDLFK